MVVKENNNIKCRNIIDNFDVATKTIYQEDKTQRRC